MPKKKTSIVEVPVSKDIVTKEQVEAVRSVIAVGSSDAELQMFVSYCNRTGLDPLAGQIHFVKRGKGAFAKATFQTSIDGYRSVAESSGKYKGQTEVEYGPMKEIVMYLKIGGQKKAVKKQVPEYAKVGIIRNDFDQPLYATAYWEEYCPSYPNQHMWYKMPRVMLAKVAEANALRKAFPKQLSGVYTTEEMEQDKTPLSARAEVVNPPEEKQKKEKPTPKVIPVKEAEEKKESFVESSSPKTKAKKPNNGMTVPEEDENKPLETKEEVEESQTKALKKQKFNEAITKLEAQAENIQSKEIAETLIGKAEAGLKKVTDYPKLVERLEAVKFVGESFLKAEEDDTPPKDADKDDEFNIDDI